MDSSNGRGSDSRQLEERTESLPSPNHAGTLRKELESMVLQGNLTKREKRIVDKDRRARRVVFYEPTQQMITYYEAHM